MIWVSNEELDVFEDEYVMGSTWESSLLGQKRKIARTVSARWAALPWLASKEPELVDPDADPQSGERELDDSLLAAFALHCRWIIDNNDNPEAIIDEDDDRQILSDIPRFTRNILLGGYINVNDEFPWSAERKRRGPVDLGFTDD